MQLFFELCCLIPEQYDPVELLNRAGKKGRVSCGADLGATVRKTEDSIRDFAF